MTLLQYAATVSGAQNSAAGVGWVVLDELDREGRVVRLDQAIAAALADTGLVEVRPEGGGAWRLLPCGKVGAVTVPGLQVQINPKEKVGLSKLIFLLGYARDPGFRPEDVVGDDEPELWPALAESLARLVERALGRGVLQGYRTLDDALRTVRGRIRIGDQITRRPGQMVPLEVSYDEFTVDIAENRVLRAALRRMLAVPRLDPNVRARLAHLDGRLDGVQLLHAREQIPRWLQSRLNERYQPALRLAEVVLRNCSAEAGPGGVRVAAFVVSMWKVFEDFVTTALTEAMRSYPGVTRAQYESWLDVPKPGKAKGEIPMRIDIAHLVGRKPVIVFDAKYKVADSSGNYPNADHYQMLAYCTALGLDRAWLVYAQGSSGIVERRIRNTVTTVVEYPLDLGVAPRDLLAQIAELGRQAWTLRALSPAELLADHL
jgi:5-methylcytosine-specific restriction enzyme subunit McrC